MADYLITYGDQHEDNASDEMIPCDTWEGVEHQLRYLAEELHIPPENIRVWRAQGVKINMEHRVIRILRTATKGITGKAVEKKAVKKREITAQHFTFVINGHEVSIHAKWDAILSDVIKRAILKGKQYNRGAELQSTVGLEARTSGGVLLAQDYALRAARDLLEDRKIFLTPPVGYGG